MSTAVADPVVANQTTVKADASAATTADAAKAAAGAQPVVAAAAPAARLLTDAAPAATTDATKSTDAAKVADAASATKPAATADWTLTRPEGVEIVDADLKAVEAFAKEHGLSQVQAEKVLGRDLAGRTAAVEAQKAEVAKIGETWLEEAKKHPEIGGANLAGAVANAQKALVAFATADERKAIAASPFANNPLFIAILNRAAKALPSEDSQYASGSQAAPAPLDPAQAIYGKMRH